MVQALEAAEGSADQTGCEFRLRTPQKTYTLFAYSPAEKAGWIQRINNTIASLNPEEGVDELEKKARELAIGDARAARSPRY